MNPDWKESYSSLERLQAEWPFVKKAGWYIVGSERTQRIDYMLVLRSSNSWHVFVWHQEDPRPSIMAVLTLPHEILFDQDITEMLTNAQVRQMIGG